MQFKINQGNPTSSSRFFACSDESGSDERYRAIGVVSGEESCLFDLRKELENILRNQGVKEVKFSEVRTHRSKLEAARLFVEKGVGFVNQRKIRIDVLVWNIHDKRHSIPGRDDVTNLEIMYYNILRHVSEQWHQHNWELYPDENSGVDWSGIKSYLNRTLMPRYKKPHLLSLFEKESYTIHFSEIEQKKSHDEPLIQLADLLAGMARFCRENGEECAKCLKSQEKIDQLSFFEYEELESKEDPIMTKQNRFKLVSYLYSMCKRYRLGVSLNTWECLWTRTPSSPINFWNYESRYDKDKAPIRKYRQRSE